ncbi:MAG: recombinase family protein [Candidatus Obscuribacter sp.]|nr:recombinase family protein [Candidatus Obscuribacter sp.]MBK9278764.1 recombinase family protein [Candidatus Obscuribacter sp.]
MKKRVAIYTRVSTKDQSCERQLNELRELARRMNYEVVGEYSETASGAKNDRQARNQVMKLAQKKAIDAVLVSELSRWGRSTADLISTLETLESRNVSVIAQSGMQMDLATASGKLMATILSGVAQFERELLIERTLSGMAAARARGKVIGREKGDNFKTGKHEERILRLKEEGKSLGQIATEVGISKSSVKNVIDRHKTQTAKPEAARELVAA